MFNLSLFLYDLFTGCYVLLIHAASPFHSKAGKWVKGRSGWQNKLPPPKKPGEKRAWFHCASLGEFEQARPVIEGLKNEVPGTRIVLTFFSPSGYEVRKDYPLADYVLYLPPDSAHNAEVFVSRVMPDVAVFARYEFWYHMINALRNRKVPAVLISAVFRKEQVFFRWYGGLFRSLLRMYDRIFVQDRDSETLLNALRLLHVRVAPDTRVDRVYQIAGSSPPLPLAEAFRNGEMVIVAGSTYPEEERMLLRFAGEAPERLKFIIAPHEVHAGRINSLISLLPSSARYTTASPDGVADKKFLVVDTIGLLSALYRYGNFAVVGGGFRKTVHNVLEPSAHGLPVLFGPHYGSFREAVELVRQGGAFSCRNYDEFKEKMMLLLADPGKREAASGICRNYIRENTGGTEIILEYLRKLL